MQTHMMTYLEYLEDQEIQKNIEYLPEEKRYVASSKGARYECGSGSGRVFRPDPDPSLSKYPDPKHWIFFTSIH